MVIIMSATTRPPKGYKDDGIGKKASLRKAAGLTSVFVGLPNFVAAVMTIILGVIGSIALVVFIIAMLLEPRKDDWAGLCIVFLIILGIIALILILIVIVISVILAIGIAGQMIGGFLAFKGKGFGWSVTLMLFGSAISLVIGIFMTAIGIFAEMDFDWVRFILVPWGLYDIASSVVTMVCAFLVISVKDSFIKKEKKVIKRSG